MHERTPTSGRKPANHKAAKPSQTRGFGHFSAGYLPPVIRFLAGGCAKTDGAVCVRIAAAATPYRIHAHDEMSNCPLAHAPWAEPLRSGIPWMKMMPIMMMRMGSGVCTADLTRVNGRRGSVARQVSLMVTSEQRGTAHAAEGRDEIACFSSFDINSTGCLTLAN